MKRNGDGLQWRRKQWFEALYAETETVGQPYPLSYKAIPHVLQPQAFIFLLSLTATQTHTNQKYKK